MSQVFIEHNNAQSYIETTTGLNRDKLFINVIDNSNFPVILAIIADEEEKGEYILTKESVQKIFDWLKNKGIVK